MAKKLLILMMIVLMGLSFPTAAFAGTVPAGYSSEENDKKASEYYKQADEHIRGVYFNAMNVIKSGHAGDFRKGKSVGEWFFSIFYNAYATVKHAAPFIILVSILLGGTVCFFAKRNKMIFRRALFVFVIGVPALMVAFVFGIGSMTTIFG